MSNNAREFIDFWIANSVHAREPRGALGAEQSVPALTLRCGEMAASVGLSKATLDEEVGDLSNYIGSRLAAANQLERERPE
ncbi:hypothetical protein IC762_22645 [Bradyrhizobium genosp. L]|uniref:hypothetical protein n=1 Tax=Bradyrhizobium genosp. L TaxID=83637 RepID=UPI0018A2E90D|nr:hypothetical protein [Bradyrhizobium genosp. L]QPF82546.1 hypothetical protein IC762_22645 [Bradyrhizobium genosp. L]